MGKILITGASGFIGSHLVDQLLEDGVRVSDLRLFILPKESLKNLPNKKFDIVWGDIRDLHSVKKALHGVEIIYHLAASTAVEGISYETSADVNVDGTQNLLDCCQGKRIKKFILFSSIAVYGLPAFGGEIINWNERKQKKPLEPYGESKLEAEKRLIKFHKLTNVPCTIIRPTTVYGPRDHQGILELYKVINSKIPFIIGDGKNLLDYVYVKDLVKGAILAQKSKSKFSEYILGCGSPISYNEIYTSVANSIHIQLSPLHVSKRFAMIASHIIHFAYKTVHLRPPLFPNRVKILTTNCYFNISKAKKELGYNPSTTFFNGANLTGKWLLAKKQL